MKNRDNITAEMLRWSERFIEQVLEAHPDSEFWIGGVYTRRSPYPSQVLRPSLLKDASDSLLGSSYYDHFTPEMLDAVGMPRGTSVISTQ